MTVRRNIAEPRSETSARRPGDWLRRLRRCLPRSQDWDRRQEEGGQSPTVRGVSEGRARWPKARRSSGSTIAAEALMNNAG